MNRLVVASTNAGKIREVSLALADLPDWNVESLPELSDVEETGTTFMENARLKADYYSRLVEAPVLADDSGLSVHALGGRPGVHSARYAPTTEERNKRLLEELAALGTDADRSAAFYCAFVVAHRGKILWTVEAQCPGRIAEVPAGEFGFGYDPVFFVPEHGKTLAQMTGSEKNQVSARGRALKELRNFLVSD